MPAPQPLTEAELHRLADVLWQFGAEDAMNVEMLDGFFAALISGPEPVPLSECLPEILGADMPDEPAPESRPVLQECIVLLTRHWNAVSHTLGSRELFLPVLLCDDDGVAHATDWAIGFMRGMEMRRKLWIKLMDDEEHMGWLVPILALAHEHHPDPEMRPYREPISAEMRERLIVGAAAGVMAIYRYFEPERVPEAQRGDEDTATARTPKVGRNDPCPCGSGKKFKRCCGASTWH